MCCFGEETFRFYSEAERSVQLANLLPQYRIYGLLADAYKGVVGEGSDSDPRYLEKARKANDAIHYGLGLTTCSRYPSRSLILWANELLLATENRDRIVDVPRKRQREMLHVAPLRQKIRPWDTEQAKSRWLCELERGLRYGDLDVPHSVSKYLKTHPHAENYAVSRGGIVEGDVLMEASMIHHAYNLDEESPFWD